MSTHHGKNGVVKIGANSVAEITGFTLELEAETAEDHACGDSWKTRLAGMNDANGSVDCWYDPSDTNGQDTMSVGASVTLLLYFEDGSASGETEWSVPCIVSRVTKTLQRDQVVEHSFEYQGNGAPTEGAA